MKLRLSFGTIIGALYIPAILLIGLIYIHETKPEFAVQMYHDIRAIIIKNSEVAPLKQISSHFQKRWEQVTASGNT